MTKQSLTFFQKREDTDDLDVFQQEEIAKLKYMLLEKEELISQEEQELELLRKEVVVLRAECQDAHGLSARLQKDLQKVQVENEKLSQQRTELTATQEGAEKKITELEIQQQELQDFIQHLSLDLQKAQSASCTTEKRLTVVQEEYEVLNLHYEQLKSKVTDLNSQIEENIQEISLKNEELIRKDEETSILKQDYDALVLKMQQFQSDLELYKTRTADGVESSAWHASSGMPQLQEQKAVQLASESQVSSAQEAVSALHQPLNGAISWKSNGEVKVADILQLQRENQELEQQIVEKNKTIKQLQQRMVELKKTLQKELKLKPEPEVNDMQEKLNPDQLATSLTVTSLSDLTDSREINFEYLKHVVLKFMSSREAEAFHLIKAVSVLLNFSVEEENLLKETLEYKVNSCSVSPDCQFILTCSDDTRIHLWEAKSGSLLKKVTGHTGPVKSCCFSPNGTIFASSSLDCTVRIWKVDNGECLHVLTDHSKSVETVCFSPDSKYIVSAGWDHLAILWKVQTGQKCKVFHGHQDTIYCSAFSTNSFYIATGSWDYTVRIWSVHGDRTDRILKGHNGNITCVCFSVSGMLASGSWDKTVRVWNQWNGSLIFLLTGHETWLRSLSFSLDGILLASSGHDKMVRLFECENGKCIKVFKGMPEITHTCTFSPKGTLLLIGTRGIYESD
ncbi:golgin subfamily A member 1-like isoform X3 [Pyxicephalus adspersus]